MRAAHPVELDPVLEDAQEPVVLSHACGILTPDVSARREVRERGECVARADGLVGAPMHELEQLDREFDVAQSALAEFQFAVGLGDRDVGLDACPHCL